MVFSPPAFDSNQSSGTKYNFNTHESSIYFLSNVLKCVCRLQEGSKSCLDATCWYDKHEKICHLNRKIQTSQSRLKGASFLVALTQTSHMVFWPVGSWPK